MGCKPMSPCVRVIVSMALILFLVPLPPPRHHAWVGLLEDEVHVEQS